MTSSERFGVLRRLAVIAFAILQVVLPDALTVADGWITAADRGETVAVHVEALGHKGCARVHQEAKCVVCQFVAHAVSMGTRASASFQCADQATRIVVARLERVRTVSRSVILPRGPPAV